MASTPAAYGPDNLPAEKKVKKKKNRVQKTHTLFDKLGQIGKKKKQDSRAGRVRRRSVKQRLASAKTRLANAAPTLRRRSTSRMIELSDQIQRI